MAKRVAIMVGTITMRISSSARRELKFVHAARSRHSKIEASPALEQRFAPLSTSTIRHQELLQRGPKLYPLHAPGKGKARALRVRRKVSIPVTAPKGGQFVLQVTPLHGSPYDGTLGPIINALQAPTGIDTRRIHVDKDIARHNYPDRFKVWISGQVRSRHQNHPPRDEAHGRRRARDQTRQGRPPHGTHYLQGREGDRINAVLTAAFDFSLLLRWFQLLLRALLVALCRAVASTHFA